MGVPKIKEGELDESKIYHSQIYQKFGGKIREGVIFEALRLCEDQDEAVEKLNGILEVQERSIKREEAKKENDTIVIVTVGTKKRRITSRKESEEALNEINDKEESIKDEKQVGKSELRKEELLESEEEKKEKGEEESSGAELHASPLNDGSDDPLDEPERCKSLKPKTKKEEKKGNGKEASEDNEEDEGELSDGEYVPEKVIDMKGKGPNTRYKIRWKGYTPEDDTWEPISSVSHLDIVKDFNKGRLAKMKKKERKPKKEQTKKKENEEIDDFIESSGLLDKMNKLKRKKNLEVVNLIFEEDTPKRKKTNGSKTKLSSSRQIGVKSSHVPLKKSIKKVDIEDSGGDVSGPDNF